MHSKGAGNPLFLRDAVLDDSLELLLQAHLSLVSLAFDRLTEENLDQIDFFLLFFITRHPGTTSTELGSLMGQSKQNLSRRINSLIARDLLIRARDHDDKRRQLLRTTEAAEGLVSEVVTSQRRQLRRAFRDIGPDGVDGFRAIVDALLCPSNRHATTLQE